MRIFLTICMVTFITSNLLGQLNDYKYIIVPKQFEGFKKVNQYQTSTLVKHLFVENGFTAVYDDALPNDLVTNRCLGLRVRLEQNSSMFTTKTALALENCNSEVVFKTQEGRSREKEFKPSFNEAITQAFESIKALNYRYAVKSGSETVTLNFKNDVKHLSESSRSAKSANSSNGNGNTVQVATQDEQSYKSLEPTESKYKKEIGQKSAKVVQNSSQTDMKGDDIGNMPVLYAQEIENGYQLVDNSPQIVMTLSKTSLSGIYSAKSTERSGIVFKKGGKWLFEYIIDGQTVQEELDIKF